MVGSDIAPLGKDAVTELNKLFDWAENQPNGMILFIDESDAFLRNRGNLDTSLQLYKNYVLVPVQYNTTRQYRMKYKYVRRVIE